MPHTPEPTANRKQAIDIQASQRQRDLIDHAAHLLGKSRSDFMLETACRAAEEVLREHANFRLDPEAFDQFTALLDAPPPPTDELRVLLLTNAPWD